VGIEVGVGGAPATSMRSVSIKAFSTKALPVCRWQSRQWQQWTNIGGVIST
jgi:hypothetical protein